MRKGIYIILLIFSNIVTAQSLNFTDELAYLRTYGKTPDAYVIEKFKTYDVVLLGEDHAIKNNLDFVTELIPDLHKNGVYMLGMEFGASEMQAKLDSLLVAPEYNDDLARDMMFFYNVGWAYKEYRDLYKAVWKFNKTLEKNQPKFRVLNLSYKFNWEGFTERSPEQMKRVFYRGEIDQYRSEIVEDKILMKNQKALLLVGTIHAITRYQEANRQALWQGKCEFTDTLLGNRLYQKYPNRVTNILLHAPYYSKPGENPGLISPAGGKLEEIMNINGSLPLGFDLYGTPLGKLPDTSIYSACYDKFRLEDFFDGYIFLKAFNELEGCTTDLQFFDGRDWSEVLKNYPDPDWKSPPKTKNEYLGRIIEYADLKHRYRNLTDHNLPRPSSGKIVRLKNFESDYVQPRNIDIWLPEDYTEDKKYAVLYMHDGQMLYDSLTTWNGQEWQVDETITRLLNEGKIRDCIVVGIWNNGKYRWSEYFPQKPYEVLPQPIQDSLLVTDLAGTAQADNYLKFIVKELKPYVDLKFATIPQKSQTFIAGSSMGGLISLYAICEYPDVFQAAACMSTHWIGVGPPVSKTIPKGFNAYLKEYLPDPSTHKIYFDYGNETLDQYYPPYQKLVDKTMEAKGFTNENWQTLFFPGKNHSENAWAERLHIPLEFLLGK